MRVCALVHMYPSFGHHAGAEWMLHAIMRSLAAEEHEAVVYVNSTAPLLRVGRWDGVMVYQGFPDLDTIGRYDVALTHLDESLNAARLCVGAAVPLAHVVHNPHQLAYHGVTPKTCQLAIFNSVHLSRSVRWPGEKLVCEPPVLRTDYATTTTSADRLTLVNLSREKGAGLFYDLAANEPRRHFMGVHGSYGTQDIRFNLPNVTIRQPSDSIARDVYSKTRILLMPSWQESYGRCAVEAAMSGIPSLVSDTPGLREALGPAGVYLDPTDVRAWQAAVAALDAPRAYEEARTLAYERAGDIDADSRANLARLRRRLGALAAARALV